MFCCFNIVICVFGVVICLFVLFALVRFADLLDDYAGFVGVDLLLALLGALCYLLVVSCLWLALLCTV